MRFIEKSVIGLCLAVLIVLSMPTDFHYAGIVKAQEDVTLVSPSQVQLPLAGRAISIDAVFADLNNAQIPDFEYFCTELMQFPMLTRVELCGSNLNNGQMEELQKRFPNIRFVWTIVLGNYWKIRTDQVAFSCNKGPGPRLGNADAEQLKYCTDMVALDLGHNGISDISFVKYMPNLRVLIMSDNNPLTDISPVATCTNLVYFEAWFCRIADLSPLEYLVNLQDVNVCYNWRVSDVTPILHLPRLERLFMSHCSVSEQSIKLLRDTYPNTQIEMYIEYTWHAGWRTHPRYYAMRRMYKTNTVEDIFLTDYDRLGYFAKVFDYNFYVTRYPEVLEVVPNDPVKVLYYFLNEGIYKGHQGCENFHVFEFVQNHPELQPICQDSIRAYLNAYLYGEYAVS